MVSSRGRSELVTKPPKTINTLECSGSTFERSFPGSSPGVQQFKTHWPGCLQTKCNLSIDPCSTTSCRADLWADWNITATRPISKPNLSPPVVLYGVLECSLVRGEPDCEVCLVFRVAICMDIADAGMFRLGKGWPKPLCHPTIWNGCI